MIRRSRRLATGALACALAATLAGCLAPAAPESIPSTSPEETAPKEAVAIEITHIVDGDTVRARPAGGTSPPWTVAEGPADDEVPVRLIGVDTPEVYPDLECGGNDATDALRALVSEGDTVWATRDDEERDTYDRVLLYLWTGEGTFVNLDLVATGAGEALRIHPNDRYWPLLQEAESAAIEAGAGIWSRCR
ncbi:MAG: hypothetical protein CMH38_01515 [Microbacterium sp.]|uniref:thermonuclease family protein n=1 Tax=unclassified Microbacterium TaxID=2609290 RepID=UPI000C45A604|nr:MULTISPECIES: thermonuclease family protein [unclassified Microbacterium]MAM54614.1 hypothetical protein [Microbacterium sp.]MAY48599.1 hypothetical protein [Microbacterium sp.]HAS32646.1 hypothetical protein [Microbacterium sp.]HBR87791.1 hypothetical protein [Microbacterium sp.]HBS75139.1 hypothetical protein [Microbacterium sp.]|tara:strand:- start:17389 stop:17964 length:576 start_codon:yes stop_codon:yes gene_type:complete